MTLKDASPKTGRMARPKKFVEDMVARFIGGTFARIAAVLKDGEDRTDFVREAVEQELRRREGAGGEGPVVPRSESPSGRARN